jgi:hypothetical protein
MHSRWQTLSMDPRCNVGDKKLSLSRCPTRETVMYPMPFTPTPHSRPPGRHTGAEARAQGGHQAAGSGDRGYVGGTGGGHV